jgi:release factor glutamine methyltransferase
MNLKRLLWRKLLWYRFRLFQRHRHDRLVLEWVAGRPFLILPQVFNPTLFLTSEFMVTAFNERLIAPGARVLDMGTGSGVGAVFAAQWAGRVVAVDVNPAAVRCARINVLLNGLEASVEVREGDLLTAVPDERFDVILFNPPYLRGKPENALDQAFHAENVLERFTAHLRQHLTGAGYALILLSTTGDEAAFLQLFRQHGFQAEAVARSQMPGEDVTLYKVGGNNE